MIDERAYQILYAEDEKIAEKARGDYLRTTSSINVAKANCYGKPIESITTEVCSDCSLKQDCLLMAVDAWMSFGDIDGVWSGAEADDLKLTFKQDPDSLPGSVSVFIKHKLIAKNYLLENN